MKKFSFVIFFFIQFFELYANNLQISDLKKIASNEIEFSISWNNSWFAQTAPYNYDAVWVFLKIKKANSLFEHVLFSKEYSDYKIENNNYLQVELVEDATGIFIKNSGLSSGNIEKATITCKLENELPMQNFELKIFGIEMVYVPEGEFYIGDGISKNSFGNNLNKPFKITSENTITTGNIELDLRTDPVFGPVADIPSGYPKGFAAFYCMKYEISQTQYVDFLNTLNYKAQQNRVINALNSEKGTLAFARSDYNFRNGIVISKPGNEPFPAEFACDLDTRDGYNSANDGLHIACNYINWDDLSAYLAWACLRPLTELEYEKAARGAEILPIAGEFAWGTTDITDANTLINGGQDFETVCETANNNSGIANHGYIGIMGPLRGGFAANAASDKLQAGASYYGIMELSGNLWETVVGTTPEGLLYKKTTGTGNLSELGNMLQSYWPDWKTAKGMCYRGGSWNSGIYAPGEFRDLAVSDRFYTNLPPDTRRNTSGGRGAR